MTDIDPAAVMTEHPKSEVRSRGEVYLLCDTCGEQDSDGRSPMWPCLPYRLAEALAAEQAKVARVEALANRWNRWPTLLGLVAELRAALADSPEPRVASPRA